MRAALTGRKLARYTAESAARAVETAIERAVGEALDENDRSAEPADVSEFVAACTAGDRWLARQLVGRVFDGESAIAAEAALDGWRVH